MKIYKKENVYDAALARIRYIFDEFPNIIVAFSGGKDSTVVLELSLMVAKEKNRLPLNVMWLDQEAELQSTVDYCNEVFHRPEVKPYWMQIPFKLFNSSSFFDEWLYCWDDKVKDKWVRPHSDISYKENKFGTDRFHDLFVPIYEWIAQDVPTAIICGIKANESPARRATLTSNAVYKSVTWSVHAGKHFRFSPLYDWSNEDIWVAISKNHWKYNTFYDQLFRYGVSINNMRVSSVIHETSAEWWLTKIQEIEPLTYERLQKRLDGVNTYSILGKDIRMHKLPAMFSSWEKYCYHLINHMVPPNKIKYFNDFMENKDIKKMLDVMPDKKILFYKAICQAILSNDFEGTKFMNIRNSLILKYKNATGENDKKYGQN